jgi:hypothetical protein
MDVPWRLCQMQDKPRSACEKAIPYLESLIIMRTKILTPDVGASITYVSVNTIYCVIFLLRPLAAFFPSIVSLLGTIIGNSPERSFASYSTAWLLANDWAEGRLNDGRCTNKMEESELKNPNDKRASKVPCDQFGE